MVALEVWRVNNLRDTVSLKQFLFNVFSLDFLALFFTA